MSVNKDANLIGRFPMQSPPLRRARNLGAYGMVPLAPGPCSLGRGRVRTLGRGPLEGCEAEGSQQGHAAAAPPGFAGSIP